MIFGNLFFCETLKGAVRKDAAKIQNNNYLLTGASTVRDITRL